MSSSRPPLPPKADTVGPIAPPRKGLRKGSIPDSPRASGGRASIGGQLPLAGSHSNSASRTSTLSRKVSTANVGPAQPASTSMVGRPLPPPPPPVSSDLPATGILSMLSKISIKLH